jgi:membrane protein YdbS with pleckstrin-like domain
MMQLDVKAMWYFLLQKVVFYGLLVSPWLVVVLASRRSVSGANARAAQEHAVATDAFLGNAGMVLVVLVLVYGVWCYFRARSYHFELRQEGVTLEYGVFNRLHETILYGKIQDIQVSRGPLERLLGLATVTIQPAAGRSQIIPALGSETATEFRDQIIRHLQR